MRLLGKGYLPSPKDKTGLGHPHHLLAAAPPLSAIPNRILELPRALQQLFQDCVGNGCAIALVEAMGKDEGGNWRELPSRPEIYAGARMRSGQSLLRDEGTYIHAAFEWMSDVGFLPESRWAYGPEHLTVAPDWEAEREAADQRLTIQGAYRITSEGAQRARDVAAAIAAGNTVVWGTQLDERFEDLQPGDVWPGLTGPEIGGHCMVLHGTRTNAAGGREFLTRSSWGSDWCEEGSAWVAQAAIESDAAEDFWIVAAAPAYSGTT